MENLLFGLMLILVIGLWCWHFIRSRQLVDEWIRTNGLTPVSVERRFLCYGPFWWRTGKGQAVFRVTVRDATGQTRSGYIRTGGWFLGMLSDQVDAEWDD